MRAGGDNLATGSRRQRLTIRIFCDRRHRPPNARPCDNGHAKKEEAIIEFEPLLSAVVNVNVNTEHTPTHLCR